MSERSETLLVIIDSLRQGGAERSTALFLEDAARRWRRVALISFGCESDSFVQQVKDAGVEVHFLKFRNFLLDVLSIRRKIKEIKPSAIYTVLYKSALRTRVASLFGHVPLVEALVGFRHLRASDDTSLRILKRSIHRVIDRATASRCVEKFHAVSEAIREHYTREYALTQQRIQVVSRGRNKPFPLSGPSREKNRKEIFHVDDSTQVFLLVGRTDAVKNFLLVAKAAPEIQRSLPCPVAFVLVGRAGNQQRDIDSSIVENGAASSFMQLGFRTDIAELMQSADAVIIPSVSEGLPGVAIEAISCGLPAIYSSIRASEEVLGGLPNAYAFSSGSEDALVGAVEAWFSDKSSGRLDPGPGYSRFMQRYGLEEANSNLNSLVGSCIRSSE